MSAKHFIPKESGYIILNYKECNLTFLKILAKLLYCETKENKITAVTQLTAIPSKI